MRGVRAKIEFETNSHGAKNCLRRGDYFTNYRKLTDHKCSISLVDSMPTDSALIKVHFHRKVAWEELENEVQEENDESAEQLEETEKEVEQLSGYTSYSCCLLR